MVVVGVNLFFVVVVIQMWLWWFGFCFGGLCFNCGKLNCGDGGDGGTSRTQHRLLHGDHDACDLRLGLLHVVLRLRQHLGLCVLRGVHVGVHHGLRVHHDGVGRFGQALCTSGDVDNAAVVEA